MARRCPGLTIHGPRAAAERGALVSFTLEGAHPHDIGEILGREGVCVRAGHHCAQPLMRRLGVSATTRASFAVHNSSADVDRLIEGSAHRPRRAAAVGTEMDDLYRENILEHYKRPHNWGELDRVDLEFHDLNPLCGDELTVQLAVDGEGRIEDVAFSGHGCAISQAAASMASDEIKGMKVDELLRARPLVRARPARDRHLGHADEVRAAVAQGAQGRHARARGRLGARGAREQPSRLGPAKSDQCARI